MCGAGRTGRQADRLDLGPGTFYRPQPARRPCSALPASQPERRIPMEIGGGFGGKALALFEPTAGVPWPRRPAGRSSSSVSREEVLRATGPGFTGGHYGQGRGHKGRPADGRLTAIMRYDAGAFPGSPVSPAACWSAWRRTSWPICTPKGYDVVTNKPRVAGLSGAGRDAGRPLPWIP